MSETVLVDSHGLTLYWLTSDTSTHLACTGACLSAWPPLLSPAGAPTSTTPLPGKLSVLSGPNGAQVLYNGHALYTFASDSTPADVNGEGIFSFGGTWHVATPGLAAAAVSPAAASSSTPYGY